MKEASDQYRQLYEVDAYKVSYENHNIKATLDVYLETKAYSKVSVILSNLMSLNICELLLS